MVLGKWGGSTAVRLPKNILAQTSIKANEKVTIVVEEGRIVIAPLEKYTTKWIMEGVTPDTAHTELVEDVVGQEVW